MPAFPHLYLLKPWTPNQLRNTVVPRVQRTRDSPSPNYPWDGDLRINEETGPSNRIDTRRGLLTLLTLLTHLFWGSANLRRAGNEKIDHLDKTQDLSASSAGEAASRSHFCADGGSHREAPRSPGKAKPSYPYGDLVRLVRLVRTFLQRTISLQPHKPALISQQLLRPQEAVAHACNHHIVCILSDVDVFLDKPANDTYIRMRLKSGTCFGG